MIPRKLLDEIEYWIAEKKFGHIQINFSDGRIVNINRTESLKVSNLGTIGEVKLTNHNEV